MRSFKAPPSKEDERYTNYSSPSLEFTLLQLSLGWSVALRIKSAAKQQKEATECSKPLGHVSFVYS